MSDFGVEPESLSAAVPASRGWLSPDATGYLVHAAIADVLTHGLQHRPAAWLRARAAASLPPAAPAHRQVLTARVGSAVVRYVRHCLRPPRWSFLGAELFGEDVRFDLLFVDAAGNVQGDEVKSGADPFAGDRANTRAQVRGQLLAGRAMFGPRFAGMRIVVLADPRRSRLVTHESDA